MSIARTIAFLASYGIRDDMPTYRDIITKPTQEYHHLGKCNKCNKIFIVSLRRDRILECTWCGYIVKWKTIPIGASSEHEQQDWARTAQPHPDALKTEEYI